MMSQAFFILIKELSVEHIEVAEIIRC